jgi:HD-GYP domain-containing protein (c-di-GMP phosphodiesterase class II)
MAEHREEIPRWAGALSMHDPATAAHSARVGHAARKLGRAAGLNDEEVGQVGLAGILHDIGKLDVPPPVLAKSGPLTADEWAIIRRHPDAGADMIASLAGGNSPVADAVRTHHERWDGSGYPRGLRSEAIPLMGRIIAITDVYDAITHPRCYRGTVFTAEEALLEIMNGAGHHFDPALVRVFKGTFFAPPQAFRTVLNLTATPVAAVIGVR